MLDSAKNITHDLIEKIFNTMRKIAFEKTIDFALIAVNPIGYVLNRAIDRSEKIEFSKKDKLKEQTRLLGNPLAYGIEKLYKSLKKK